MFDVAVVAAGATAAALAAVAAGPIVVVISNVMICWMNDSIRIYRRSIQYSIVQEVLSSQPMDSRTEIASVSLGFLSRAAA